MEQKATDSDALWKQYGFYIDLYKFYLDLGLKTNTFFYAVTGGILSFYFANYSQEGLLEYSLLLPILMSTALGVYFLFGVISSKKISKQVDTLVNQLGIHIDLQVWILTLLLLGSSIIFFVVAISMILLMVLR